VAEHAVEILETLPPSPALAHAYCCLGWSYNRSGDSAEARLWGGRAVELADRFDCDALASDARAQLAVAEGDVDALLVEIERAAELENFELAAALHVNLGFVLHRHERVDLNDEMLDRGIALCSERGIELYRLYLVAMRARHELAQGRWDDAVASAGAVLRWPRTSTMPRILALATLALVRARRGDPEVEPLLDEAWALAEPTNEPDRMTPVLDARAEAEWLEGRAGLPGSFAQPFGSYEHAVVDGDLSQLRALGASRTADVVARKLGKRGARRSTLANPAGLTRRELEVLPLVARGLSNREIAGRLVVSDRTVEHHVTAILRKLEVHTRAEASAAAVRLGVA